MFFSTAASLPSVVLIVFRHLFVLLCFILFPSRNSEALLRSLPRVAGGDKSGCVSSTQFVFPIAPNSNPLFSSRVLRRRGLEPDESCPNHVRIGPSCSDELLLAIIERFGGGIHDFSSPLASPKTSTARSPLQQSLPKKQFVSLGLFEVSF